jgi:hypothetical protein
LSARFYHDGNIPPDIQRTDDHGFYFIAQDEQLFGKHILPYLVTNDANISSFAKDFKLYGINCKTKPPFMVSMHSLYHLLHVTSSFHLEENGDQGVLYWLGIHTDTKIHTQRLTS